ncbi:uncharacterized protein [Dasypus novemcinctus]|uniref:uncharacterized protein isoform X2 n=1 Tax=Dasypus novemcinctus TaxID=9361 RepID=UPI0039C8E637
MKTSPNFMLVISGSAVRSAFTELEGNNPSLDGFHLPTSWAHCRRELHNFSSLKKEEQLDPHEGGELHSADSQGRQLGEADGASGARLPGGSPHIYQHLQNIPGLHHHRVGPGLVVPQEYQKIAELQQLQAGCFYDSLMPNEQFGTSFGDMEHLSKKDR